MDLQLVRHDLTNLAISWLITRELFLRKITAAIPANDMQKAAQSGQPVFSLGLCCSRFNCRLVHI